jgi:hypothetical protein
MNFPPTTCFGPIPELWRPQPSLSRPSWIQYLGFSILSRISGRGSPAPLTFRISILSRSVADGCTHRVGNGLLAASARISTAIAYTEAASISPQFPD